MLKGRIVRLVLATLLLASPALVPVLAGALHLEATSSAAAAPAKVAVVQVHAHQVETPKPAKVNSALKFSPDEVKANKTVETWSLLLWAISLVGLSLLLRWTVGSRNKPQVQTTTK